MEADHKIANFAGFPELTPLGKRIEMLRIERGLSKQYLARFAGTSRQQLWRVMTGKSELTGSLKSRLADALNVAALEFDLTGHTSESTTSRGLSAETDARVVAYIADPQAITRTLMTMPAGDDGRALKRRFLDLLEDMALAVGCSLDADFFDLRRKVLAGQL
jgi:transcriptional regulator with XRE-family HTH domain